MAGSTQYDPRAHGAQCDRCPLNGHVVVPPEGPDNADIAIIGEAPGEEEERNQRPFVGNSGKLLDDTLRAAYIRRNQVLIGNVLCCRPPGNELSALLSKISRDNGKAKKAWLEEKEAAEAAGLEPPPEPEPIPSPVECCKPRFLHSIRNIPNRITLGKTATNALTGGTSGVLSVRGGVIVLQDPNNPDRKLKTMPTVHPAFALRQPRWMHVFKNDVFKAGMWFRGEADWVPPKFVWNPTPDELRAFLASSDLFAYDLETDGIEPLTCKIRCICIATPDVAFVMSFLGQDGISKFYDAVTEQEIVSIIIAFLLDGRKTKVGHNVLGYDSPVILANWGIWPVNQIDTLLIHRNVEPELPHGLAYVGSMYALAPNWKVNDQGEKLSTGARDDLELATYCGGDGCVNIRVLPKLVDALSLRDQVEVWESDSQIQLMCADMHRIGMYVDQKARLEEEVKLLKARWEVRQRIQSFLVPILGAKKAASFNPGSVQQLRDLLFNKFGLDPQLAEEEKYTKTAQVAGDLGWEGISTGDLILRSLLFDPLVSDEHQTFIKMVRRFRKLQKILGTYVCKLRPSFEENKMWWAEDDDDGEEVALIHSWADSDTKKRYGKDRVGIVDPRTGRMHPGWSSAVTATGRLAGSKPMNCFDGETEVLTEQGWVRFDALRKGVPVAQYHWGGKIDFVVPLAYQERDHEGAMVEFQTQSSDLLLTPDHRVPLRKTSGKLETVTAEKLLTIGAGRRTIHAGQLEAEGLPLSIPEIRLLVAMQADAHITDEGELDVSFAKPRKTTRFKKLLEEAGVRGWTFSELPYYNDNYEFKTRFAVPAEGVRHLVQLIGQERMWGSWLLQMNQLQREAFCHEIWYWDSHHEEQNQYANHYKSNADWIQTILCLTGIRANQRWYQNSTGGSAWIVSVRKTPLNEVTRRAHRQFRPWKGRVYCLTVPSDMILVRRNGKVTVTHQCQNVPLEQRKMFTAAPGNILIGADMDQLELRIAAALWEVQLYLRAFREGKDPHSMTAFAVFGEAFCRAAKIDPKQFRSDWTTAFSGGAYDEKGNFDKKKASPEAKEMRDLSKVIQYASQYMGSDATVHKVVQKTEVAARDKNGKELEDGTTDLPYAKKQLRETRKMKQRWLEGAREFAEGWEREITQFKREGYLREPVGGRRRDFLDAVLDPDAESSTIVNFKVQGSAAGLVNRMMIQLREVIAPEQWGPGTGMINQCHDSIVFEAPADGVGFDEKGKLVIPHGRGPDDKHPAIPFQVVRVMNEIMNVEHPNLPGVRFTAAPAIGRTWKEV